MMWRDGLTVEMVDEVESTNSELKRRATDGAPDGAVLIARRQTGGRGRLGRTFFSPEGGLYMSVLLRRAIESPQLLTVAAAVAVAEAAEALCGRTLAIKWVNDLYLDGRKVCGILAEALTDGEGTPALVVGVGVNLAPPRGGFPDEVREIAGALMETAPPDAAERLATGILDRLLPFADALPAREYLAGYRARSMLMGQTVDFCENGVWRQGVACGIDDDGGLRVRLPEGERTLRSGDVTMHRE